MSDSALADILERERVTDGEQRYRIDGWAGIAFWYDRPETFPDDDTEWTGEEVPTGNVLMVMVGDDRRHVIDPEDVHPIDDDEYCPECGQIGCTAYA